MTAFAIRLDPRSSRYKMFASVFNKVKNADSAHPMVRLVVALDCSGSMRANDAVDRATGKRGVNRLMAAKSDIRAHYGQLSQRDRVSVCTLLVFGERLRIFPIGSVAELDTVLSTIKADEAFTRTDLVLGESNRLFAEFKKTTSNETFCTIVYTDGEPTRRRAVANLLIEGTELMTDDKDRATTFIQYGEDASAAEFLSFLDHNLTDLAIELYKKDHPGATPDDYKDLYDACDMGGQCTPWSKKNPKKVVKDPSAFWDSDVHDVIDEATSD
jgi:hypothetical protein